MRWLHQNKPRQPHLSRRWLPSLGMNCWPLAKLPTSLLDVSLALCAVGRAPAPLWCLPVSGIVIAASRLPRSSRWPSILEGRVWVTCGREWKEEILLWQLIWSSLLKWWGGNLRRSLSFRFLVGNTGRGMNLTSQSLGQNKWNIARKVLSLGAGRGGRPKAGDDVGVTVSLLRLHLKLTWRAHTHLSGYRDPHRQLFHLFIHQRLLRPCYIVRAYPRPCEHSKQKNHTRPSRTPLPTGGDKHKLERKNNFR